MTLTVRREGVAARFTGTIPPELDRMLVEKFSWVNPLDLSETLLFYEGGEMYQGIAEDVVEFCTDNGYDTELEDLSAAYHGAFAWKFTGSYWPGQEEAVRAMVAAGSGALVAPPGAGKTVIMAAMVAEIGRPALIVTHAQLPFNQVVDSVDKFTNVPDIGVIGESSQTVGGVTVATIQSLYSLLSTPGWERSSIGEWLHERAEVLIIDEAHHTGSDSTYALLGALGAVRHVFGVTATYRRDDERDGLMRALIGRTRHQITYGQQIDSGNMCPLTVYIENVPAKDYGYTSNGRGLTDRPVSQYQRKLQYQKVYEDYVINGATGRNEMAAAFAKEAIDEGLTVAVLVSRIEHAALLSKMIPGSEVLVSSGPAALNKRGRDDTMDRLRHRELRCVVTTLFDEAVDVPSLDVVVFAGGGKSSVKAEQRVRSTRKFSGDLRTGHYDKERGFVYYLVDKCDFLKSHSQAVLKVLKGIVAQHPRNELIDLTGKR